MANVGDNGSDNDTSGAPVPDGNPQTLSRRTVLQGALAGALALPLVKALPGGSSGTLWARAKSETLSVRSSFRRSGILIAANSSEPDFIDPSNAEDIQDFSTVRSVYDGLAQWNSSYSAPVPALALSWSSNSNATEWVFNLRPGVKFHDGTPFDSTAAKQSVLYYLPNNWGLLFSNLTSVDDSNPMVLKLRFSKPSPDLLRNQTWVKMISPKLIQAKAVAERAVGTGPFIFDSWTHGQKVTLSANPDYWNPTEPRVDGVQLLTVADETARVEGLESGSLDLIMTVSPLDIAALKSNSSLKLSSAPSWSEWHLLSRCDQPLTSDVRVRQAIAYGVDREAILKDIMLGQGVVATSPIPQGCYGHISATTSYSYNPAKARQLLKSAGYPNGITLNMAAESVLNEQLVGEAMVPQLAEAGIKVNFEVLEPGVAFEDLLSSHPKHQLFILVYGWVNGGPFHFDAGTALAHPKYKGAELTALVHACTTTADGPARLRYLAEAQNLFMEQLPHFPLFYPVVTDAFAKKVTGYEVAVDGYQPVFATTSFAR
jgi:peptide/nickel transport system substrate-binding protein